MKEAPAGPGNSKSENLNTKQIQMTKILNSKRGQRQDPAFGQEWYGVG